MASSMMLRLSITKGLNGPILSRTNFGGLLVRCSSSGPPAETVRYDLVVIGGGSGGLACAKEAADLGKRVAVLDYVDASPRGSIWGLGGTCVNVGCIPKKLMHQASLIGSAVRQAAQYGWEVPVDPTFSWDKLTDGVQNHIKSLNWGHRVKLRDKHVDYYNAKGFVEDRNTVLAYQRPDQSVHSILKTDHIVIATGMRPRYPSECQVPGALQYAITSDDIFWLKQPPGKTLCVGASYVALECAGFLTGFGYKTTVMVRSTPLGRFDKEMAGLVVRAMEEDGTKFLMECIPKRMEHDTTTGRIKVTFVGTGNPSLEISESFDTVLMAIGRVASTSGLGLAQVGVQLDDSGFIVGNHYNDQECSSVSNIYAIGDVLKDQPELTPVAVRAGKLLARRIFGVSSIQMEYDKVATTVFTPLEYSFVGLSEEAATAKLGSDGLEVYHAFFKPLEYTIPNISTKCFLKVITDHSPNGQVVGIHYAGPNAGEVMQGFAVAFRLGLTKEKLTSTTGIHPTCAEELVKLHISKRSGIDPNVTGC